MPFMRRRAQTFRWPSPWNGLAARTVADLGGELQIRQRADRAAALPVRLRLAMPVHARPGHAPDPADAGQAIGLAAARREGPAHRLDLL